MNRPRITPGQSRAEIDFLSRPAKRLVLPDISFGRCDQVLGRLLFNPDGSGTWTCSTSNANPHHVASWRSSFTLQNLHGDTLFGIGPFSSPEMPPGNPLNQVAWSSTFEFPTAYFSEIASVSQNCNRSLVISLKQADPRPVFKKLPESTTRRSTGWPWGQLYLNSH